MRLLLTRGYHFDTDSWSNITFVKRLGTPPAPPAEVGYSSIHAYCTVCTLLKQFCN